MLLAHPPGLVWLTGACGIGTDINKAVNCGYWLCVSHSDLLSWRN